MIECAETSFTRLALLRMACDPLEDVAGEIAHGECRQFIVRRAWITGHCVHLLPISTIQ